MTRQLVKQLLALTLVIAVAAVNAQPIQEAQGGQGGQFVVKPIPMSRQARSIYDQYTLGQQVDGAQIIYSNQLTQSYENVQPEVTLDFSYPDADAVNTKTITEVTLYLEAADGATTQAYVTEGGIGETSITLQMVAKNSDSLRYMIVIYGKQD